MQQWQEKAPFNPWAVSDSWGVVVVVGGVSTNVKVYSLLTVVDPYSEKQQIRSLWKMTTFLAHGSKKMFKRFFFLLSRIEAPHPHHVVGCNASSPSPPSHLTSTESGCYQLISLSHQEGKGFEEPSRCSWLSEEQRFDLNHCRVFQESFQNCDLGAKSFHNRSVFLAG